MCCSATMSLCCGGGGVLLWVATYVFILLLHLCLAGAYDPMDPNGNITIKWDFKQFRDDGYTSKTGVMIEGPSPSQAFEDSSPDLDDDDIESELRKAFSSYDEDLEIM
ncbi:hypothetical protein M5K25_016519 [Dendrobium thyrsiflorum]|uniref:Uncharacterized protein n=1 Tax=Dendrobium thyrsiflorum TaxID=117978 RepID=A0ABD0URQ9_DENTH